LRHRSEFGLLHDESHVKPNACQTALVSRRSGPTMKLRIIPLAAALLFASAHAGWAATSYTVTVDGQDEFAATPQPASADAGLHSPLEQAWYADPLSRDYVVSYDKDPRSNRYAIFNASVAHPVGVTTATFAGTTDSRQSALTRLESAWSWSVPDSVARLRVGDGISNPGTWGHAVRFGGIQFGTAQGTRSDVITAPLLGASGVAVLPSTADLLSDDLRNAVIRGAPFAGMRPQVTTPGNVNIAVNDALGRSYVLSQPLFQSIALMPLGQSDFSFEAGRVREDYARRSDQYGSWLASGTYSYGLGKAATLDAHIATIDNEVSVMGLGLAERFGSLGLVSATMATSRTADSSGWLARMGYEVSINRVNFAVRSHLQSLSFQDLRATVGAEPLRERTLASAGMSIDHIGNVSIAGVSQTFGDGAREGVVALSHSVPLGATGLFSTAATYAPGMRNSSVLLSVSYPFATGKHKKATNSTRNVINNITDQNLLAVLDSTRPLHQ
jgi:outer membrane usher protein